MKITKDYLKEIIKEELKRVEEGGVPIGSPDDEIAKLGYFKGEPDYISRGGVLRSTLNTVISRLNSISKYLEKQETEQAKKVISDTIKMVDTTLTGFDASRMAPMKKQ